MKDIHSVYVQKMKNDFLVVYNCFHHTGKQVSNYSLKRLNINLKLQKKKKKTLIKLIQHFTGNKLTCVMTLFIYINKNNLINKHKTCWGLYVP